MGKPKAPVKFPLWLHQSGQWCKKHRGKSFYFGTGKDEALKRFVSEWEDIKAGRDAKPAAEGTTVRELCDEFLNAKRNRMESGELSARMWASYFETCMCLAKVLGKNRLVSELRTADFAKLRKGRAKDLGPVSLGNFVQRVRTIFKYGFEAELIQVPVRFGPDFAKPPRRSVRIQRADRGVRMFEPEEIRALLKAARPAHRAMILLAINGGFGPTDCSELPRSALARADWIDFRRPKTGSARKFPLWPETVKAIDEATKCRPDPLDPSDDRLVFLTKYGRPFVRFKVPGGQALGTRNDGVGYEFLKLVRKLNLPEGRGFYALRHTFRTIADSVLDPVAVGLIMGHVDDTLAGQYRERVDEDRLSKVANYVRKWLYGKA